LKFLEKNNNARKRNDWLNKESTQVFPICRWYNHIFKWALKVHQNSFQSDKHFWQISIQNSEVFPYANSEKPEWEICKIITLKIASQYKIPKDTLTKEVEKLYK
jgi:hypothetical protein